MARKLLTGAVMEGRNGEIWDMFIQNVPVTHIAKHFGISPTRCRQILRKWAETQEEDELPRATERRARLEQVDWFINDLTEEYKACTHLGPKILLDKEIRSWFEFRAKLKGEYSQPYAGAIVAETTHYILEMDDDVRKALE